MEKKDNAIPVGIIGDVGGTYARFGLLAGESSAISEIRVFQIKDYPSIDRLISEYCVTLNLPQSIKKGCIAVAGVVDGDSIKMTNTEWRFSGKGVKERLGFETLVFINDFSAQAWGVREISSENIVQIGGGERRADSPFVVIGPGSGLGVSGGLFFGKEVLVISSEGGHAGFAPQDALEIEILKYLTPIFGRVSNERLLSGPGIENLHQAILHIHDVETERLSAFQITENALSGACPFCREAFQVFCSVLGGVSGDLALTMGATGGVYITGGILPRFIEFLKTSPFRKRFEEKGRFESYLKQIPVFVVTSDHPGLWGARAVFQNLSR